MSIQSYLFDNILSMYELLNYSSLKFHIFHHKQFLPLVSASFFRLFHRKKPLYRYIFHKHCIFRENLFYSFTTFHTIAILIFCEENNGLISNLSCIIMLTIGGKSHEKPAGYR